MYNEVMLKKTVFLLPFLGLFTQLFLPFDDRSQIIFMGLWMIL